MLPGAPPDDEELGARIRALRLERGMSLRALATALGISPSALSQMERGKMRPSVTRLFQIVSILQVPLAAAFGEDVPAPAAAEPVEVKPDEVVLARSGDVPALSLGHGVEYRRLTPVPIPGVEIFESVYPPGSSSSQDAEYLRHSGHEMGSVLSGTLTLDIGFERYELGPGDSIRFPSTTPHRIRNTGDVPAVAVWVNLP
ncbi:cupin domain-containing protein [Prauserella oleivorans]|uniref:Cupin domain-containing protein n=1 Tax=Prauserella oleivorans TaxID=1478153 RepID=A0ABW5W964_9PSEU